MRRCFLFYVRVGLRLPVFSRVPFLVSDLACLVCTVQIKVLSLSLSLSSCCNASGAFELLIARCAIVKKNPAQVRLSRCVDLGSLVAANSPVNPMLRPFVASIYLPRATRGFWATRAAPQSGRAVPLKATGARKPHQLEPLPVRQTGHPHTH